jgi:uncharacterized protein YifE (UPF0438 family)
MITNTQNLEQAFEELLADIGQSFEDLLADNAWQLKELPHFPFLFSEEEKNYLLVWGEKAEGLQAGRIPPETEKEKLFIDVCKGIRPPESKFHRLWLRYSQAVLAESRVYDAEYKILHLKKAIAAAKKIRSDLKAELDKKLHVEKGLRKDLYELKIKFGVPVHEQAPTRLPKKYDDDWGNDWREQA